MTSRRPRRGRLLPPSLLSLGAILAALPLLGCGASPTAPPAPPATPASTSAAPSASVASSGCPAQAEARSAAAAFRREGRLIRARDALRESLAKCADDPDGIVSLAEVLIDLARYDEAKTLLGSAPAGAVSATREAALRRLETESAASRDRKPDPARALQSSRSAMIADLASDHTRAREAFLDAWKAWPQRAQYLVDAGLSARRGGDLVLARSLFDRASSVLEAQHGPTSLQLEPLPGLEGSSVRAALSQDAKFLVLSSGDDVYVFDTRTWTVRSHFKDRSYPKPTAARLSPDNSVLAIANGNQTLQLVDAATGNLLTTCSGHRSWVLDVAFRPDGGAVATTSEDKTVRVWEVPSGRLIHTLTGHEGSTRRVAFSPDGSLLASTSDDRTVRLWSASDGKLLRTMKGHGGTVRGLAFRHDGTQLVTSSEDKTVRVWEIDTGNELRVMRGHTDKVWRVAFSPDGSQVASFSADETARVWNASTGALLRTIRSSTASRKTALQGDSSSQEPRDSLRLASLGGFPVLAGGGGGGYSYGLTVVVDIFYRADGKLLAFDVDHSQDTRGLSARLWDVDSDRSLRSFRSRQTIVGALAISPDAKRLAQAFYAGTVRVWNLEGGPSHPLIRVSNTLLRSVAWVSGHSALAVGDNDGTVFLVDPTGATPPRVLGKLDATAGGLAVSQDGTTLVAASHGGGLAVWSLPDGKLLRSLPKSDAKPAGPTAITADGKRMALARSFDGPVVVDTTVPAVVSTAKEKLPGALIAFGSDGNVVQLGPDGKLIVVDPSTGEVKRTVPWAATSLHLCDWIRLQHSQASCAETRTAPHFGGSGTMRLPRNISVLASSDLAASDSRDVGLDVWRPGADGLVVQLIGAGDAAGAGAIQGGSVELFGDDASQLVACGWGSVRMPFEVCEDRFRASGVLARAMKDGAGVGMPDRGDPSRR